MAQVDVVKGSVTKIEVTLTPPGDEDWSVPDGQTPTYVIVDESGNQVGAEADVLSHVANPISAVVAFDSRSLAVGAYVVSVMFPYIDSTDFEGIEPVEQLVYVQPRGRRQ